MHGLCPVVDYRPERAWRYCVPGQARDEVLGAGDAGVAKVLEHYPAADRQHLRQLLRQHQKEQRENKPPSAARKLFRYLRELAES